MPPRAQFSARAILSARNSAQFSLMSYTHPHPQAAMNQKHLLRFIKKKFKSVPDEVVARRKDGAPMTLAEVFEEHGITPYDLNLDALGMHTDTSTFCRFDKFNLKCDARAILGAQFCRRAILRAILRRPIATVDRYNPLGKSQLREVFLKTDNAVHGRYFAELTAELFDDLAESKYQHAENRISIYGRDREEWDELAAWVVDHKLYSPHNRWLIQVPRIPSPSLAPPRLV